MDAFMSEELKPLLEELEELLSTMQIPERRKADYRWIMRNLAFQNSHHPSFDRVMDTLSILLRNEEV